MDCAIHEIHEIKLPTKINDFTVTNLNILALYCPLADFRVYYAFPTEHSPVKKKNKSST